MYFSGGDAVIKNNARPVPTQPVLSHDHTVTVTVILARDVTLWPYSEPASAELPSAQSPTGHSSSSPAHCTLWKHIAHGTLRIRPLWKNKWNSDMLGHNIFSVLRQLRDLLFQKCCGILFIPRTLHIFWGELFVHPFFNYFLENTVEIKSWIVSGFCNFSCITLNKIQFFSEKILLWV